MTLTCLICGTTRFNLEDGVSTCSECGSHQINFVELVEEEDAWDTNRSRFYINPNKILNRKNQKARVEDTLDWSSIEAYNYILKRWTDILIQYGATSKLREAVFKLWTCYLQKRRIAFCENEKIESSQKEEIGVYTTRDMVVLKKAKIITEEKKDKEKTVTGDLDHVKEKVRKKVLKLRNSTKKQSTIMDRFISSQMSETLNAVDYIEEEEEMELDSPEKKRKKNENASLDESALMIEDLFNEESPSEKEMPEEQAPPDEPEIEITRKRTKHVIATEDKFSERFLILSPTFLNLEKLLAILYLGLLLAEEDVLLLDLLRWCREDFLPFQSASYLLPKNTLFGAGDLFTFNRSLPNAAELRYYAGSVALYISLQSLPLPSAERVVNKFVDSLRLPDEVRTSALLIFQCFMFKGYTQITIPPIETTIAAAILLIFKVTFGMDDVHEEILSDCANTINKILKAKKKKYRIFSWRKWHTYMNRLIHWTDQMMSSNLTNVKRQCVKTPINVERFNHYFWSQGIWKTPVDRQPKKKLNSESWDSCLLSCSLGLNMKTLKQVTNVEPLFQPYSTPFIDLVDQYISGAQCHDTNKDSEEKFQIAKSLSSESYSSHRFNWLLFNHEIISEFNDIQIKIKINKIPLESPLRSESIFTESQKKNPHNIYIPDPLECFEHIDPSTSVEKLPGNFQWLLKVLSRICETSNEDVLKQYSRLEKMYLTTIRTKNIYRKKISTARGEIC